MTSTFRLLLEQGQTWSMGQVKVGGRVNMNGVHCVCASVGCMKLSIALRPGVVINFSPSRACSHIPAWQATASHLLPSDSASTH
eukprot:2096413-Amphidinium_carterae.1